MPSDYSYLEIDELEAKLRRLDEQIESGSQTGVGIEPRISHTFAPRSYEELIREKRIILLTLHEKALEKCDPVLLQKYPDPRAPGITRGIFC